MDLIQSESLMLHQITSLHSDLVHTGAKPLVCIIVLCKSTAVAAALAVVLSLLSFTLFHLVHLSDWQLNGPSAKPRHHGHQSWACGPPAVAVVVIVIMRPQSFQLYHQGLWRGKS